MPNLLGRILVYAHCYGVTVSSTHFPSQKVLANYGYSMYNQLQTYYFFKFYKFSVQSGTGNPNKIFKIWLSYYIIINHLNNFLPLGTKVNFVNELRSTKKNQVPKHY